MIVVVHNRALKNKKKFEREEKTIIGLSQSKVNKDWRVVKKRAETLYSFPLGFIFKFN